MTLISKWEDASNKIAQSFIFRHFGRTADWYWIGDIIGGTFEVADRFFIIQDTVDFEREHYTSEEMFAYYDQALDLAMKNSYQDSKKKDKFIVNISNWKKICTSSTPATKKVKAK